MLEIKIKYHADIERIKKIEEGDWIDLRAAEDVFIPFMKSEMISLGVSMQLPEGYEAHVLPRSSTFKNFGIIMTNGMGIIDNSYCGNNDIWKFPAFCLRNSDMRETQIKDEPYRLWEYVNDPDNHGSQIRKGDRICQFRIVKKQPEIMFTEVEELTGKNRGGFGSTGKD